MPPSLSDRHRDHTVPMKEAQWPQLPEWDRGTEDTTALVGLTEKKATPSSQVVKSWVLSLLPRNDGGQNFSDTTSDRNKATLKSCRIRHRGHTSFPETERHRSHLAGRKATPTTLEQSHEPSPKFDNSNLHIELILFKCVTVWFYAHPAHQQSWSRYTAY